MFNHESLVRVCVRARRFAPFEFLAFDVHPNASSLLTKRKGKWTRAIETKPVG
jgi:hypothetical protein